MSYTVILISNTHILLSLLMTLLIIDLSALHKYYNEIIYSYIFLAILILFKCIPSCDKETSGNLIQCLDELGKVNQCITMNFFLIKDWRDECFNY